MKLLTHNLLSSHVRGVGPRGFPLRLQATEVRINPVEFNPDFVARMIPKVEWAALLEAAETLHLVEVPKGPIEGYEHDEKFLRQMHHVLLEVRASPSLASPATHFCVPHTLLPLKDPGLPWDLVSINSLPW
uniref:tRNA methyltransferase activator subunit 11-2 n=1 Tax=Canis lupus dingo TaxID=286419 RepID=A0A8C0KJD6_CANLU